jgi:hypothetical protein
VFHRDLAKPAERERVCTPLATGNPFASQINEDERAHSDSSPMKNEGGTEAWHNEEQRNQEK